MKGVIQKFECETCGAQYTTAELAQRCFRQVFPLVAKVGDIVTSRAGFGGYDGDPRWISNPKIILRKVCPNGNGNCFGECCTYSFFYVVTAITKTNRDGGKRGHHNAYHLRTLAMTDTSGYEGGWTSPDGHVGLRLVKNPSAVVVAASKALIGWTADRLL